MPASRTNHCHAMLTTLRSSLPRLLFAGLFSLMLGAAAHAQQVLRVTAIPDESPTELARKAAPLVKYLEARLGMKVETAASVG